MKPLTICETALVVLVLNAKLRTMKSIQIYESLVSRWVRAMWSVNDWMGRYAN